MLKIPNYAYSFMRDASDSEPLLRTGEEKLLIGCWSIKEC